MHNKTIAYSKRIGEARVPVTTRVEWLADGVIKPRMYWMPDCTCYQVVRLYETTPLAFLKERGTGVRFKVMAELTGTLDPCHEVRFSRHETYLYLTDNMYSGKNIVDSRYFHEGKEYISVVMDIFSEGKYELVYFWVQGNCYKVEKTLEIKPMGSYNTGGVGLRHKVEARLSNTNDHENSTHRLAALYFELNKWFIRITKP